MQFDPPDEPKVIDTLWVFEVGYEGFLFPSNDLCVNLYRNTYTELVEQHVVKVLKEMPYSS